MTPSSEASATHAVVTDSAPPPTPEPAPLVVDLGKIELAALRAALSKKLQVSEKVIVTVVVEPVPKLFGVSGSEWTEQGKGSGHVANSWQEELPLSPQSESGRFCSLMGL